MSKFDRDWKCGRGVPERPALETDARQRSSEEVVKSGPLFDGLVGGPTAIGVNIALSDVGDILLRGPRGKRRGEFVRAEWDPGLMEFVKA